MKKLGVIFTILALVAIVGCGTTGGATASKSSGGGGGDAAPFIVDLSKLSTVDIPSGGAAETADKTKTVPGVKNKQPLTKDWADVLILLPPDALPTDFSKYKRVTITCKYYDAAGEEIEQSDSRVMAVVIYDVNGDVRGPAMGPGANTPVKEMNVGGFSGLIQKDKGIRVSFAKAPQAVMFQNNPGSGVAFVELTSLVFHNGDYSSAQ